MIGDYWRRWSWYEVGTCNFQLGWELGWSRVRDGSEMSCNTTLDSFGYSQWDFQPLWYQLASTFLHSSCLLSAPNRASGQLEHIRNPSALYVYPMHQKTLLGKSPLLCLHTQTSDSESLVSWLAHPACLALLINYLSCRAAPVVLVIHLALLTLVIYLCKW